MPVTHSFVSPGVPGGQGRPGEVWAPEQERRARGADQSGDAEAQGLRHDQAQAARQDQTQLPRQAARARPAAGQEQQEMMMMMMWSFVVLANYISTHAYAGFLELEGKTTF